jgi:hypothetical protein
MDFEHLNSKTLHIKSKMYSYFFNISNMTVFQQTLTIYKNKKIYNKLIPYEPNT